MAAKPGNKYAAYTDKEIKALGKELLEWAETAEDIHLMGFCLKKKKSYAWLAKLAEENEKFAPYYKTAKSILGRKILNHSFYNPKVNAYVGMKYLGRYDKEYKDLQKEENSNSEGFKNLSDLIKELKK